MRMTPAEVRLETCAESKCEYRTRHVGDGSGDALFIHDANGATSEFRISKSRLEDPDYDIWSRDIASWIKGLHAPMESEVPA